jgi:hypothetical protein
MISSDLGAIIKFCERLDRAPAPGLGIDEPFATSGALPALVTGFVGALHALGIPNVFPHAEIISFVANGVARTVDSGKYHNYFNSVLKSGSMVASKRPDLNRSANGSIGSRKWASRESGPFWTRTKSPEVAGATFRDLADCCPGFPQQLTES